MQLLFTLPRSDAALVREVLADRRWAFEALAARYQRRAAAIARFTLNILDRRKLAQRDPRRDFMDERVASQGELVFEDPAGRFAGWKPEGPAERTPLGEVEVRPRATQVFNAAVKEK